MPTDDERRNVAAKLRETCDEIEDEGNALTVWELADVLNIRDDDSSAAEGLDLDDARHLADLIDRPTCRNVGDDYMFQCSECGAKFEPVTVSCDEYGNVAYTSFNPLYCSVCGTAVVLNGN